MNSRVQQKLNFRLRSNENLFGPSPAVLEIIKENSRGYNLYPGPLPEALYQKVALMHRVESKEVVFGAGSVQIIDILIWHFCEADDNVIFPDGSFVAYRLLSEFHKRNHKIIPTIQFQWDAAGILKAIDNKSKLIFIANPNNPTGSMISHDAFENFMDKVPDNVLVVLDEAYAEYVKDPDYPDSSILFKKYPNLIILRTFSKIYGLAACRLGYAIAREDIAKQIDQHRLPFAISELSGRAAMAALDDQRYVKECARINAEERGYLYREIRELGYHVLPSQSNFLYLYFKTPKTKEALRLHLLDRGIVARDITPFGHPNGLRFSTWHHEASLKVLKAITSFKGR